jgi:hypothetical protein
LQIPVADRIWQASGRAWIIRLRPRTGSQVPRPAPQGGQIAGWAPLEMLCTEGHDRRLEILSLSHRPRIRGPHRTRTHGLIPSVDAVIGGPRDRLNGPGNVISFRSVSAWRCRGLDGDTFAESTVPCKTGSPPAGIEVSTPSRSWRAKNLATGGLSDGELAAEKEATRELRVTVGPSRRPRPGE